MGKEEMKEEDAASEICTFLIEQEEGDIPVLASFPEVDLDR